MKIYVVDDSMQDGVDYTNAVKDALVIMKITKDLIVCPKNQSVPERMIGDIDCDIATTSRKAMAIGVADGDYCFTYQGKDKTELKDKIVQYVTETNPDLSDIGMAFRYENGNKGGVYAPIKNGIEFAFYRGTNFNCNYSEFNSAFNENKQDCSINLESLVDYLANEFDAEVLTELPTDRKHIKNNRGTIRSCNTGKNIFDVKKKTFRIRCPMVLDGDTLKPQVLLCGFSGINNTVFEPGEKFVIGDIDVELQDDEEIVKQLLEEKGGVEWVG